MSSQVQGFDYTTGKGVAYAPKEWRQRYPAARYARATGLAPGETWYKDRATGRWVAEAYAVVPA